MHNWSDHLHSFYTSLAPATSLPSGVHWLFPQADESVRESVRSFLNKFYADAENRTILLGINPGRFGAGVTGVNFTAPKQLREDCGIDHPFAPGSELSAEFIYKVINAFGGAASFYRHFFIGSVCPLGFVRGGKNLNYYDDKALAAAVEPFIIDSMDRLLSLNYNKDVCLCIGGEKNFKYLSRLNEKLNWFGEIVPLPHPRFIMQYRRKYLEEHVDQYLSALHKALDPGSPA